MSTPELLPPVGPKSAGLFKPVVAGRISEMIVEQIRTLIRDGQLRGGDRLPSERDLCQQFGVSRVTVRDALRLLEGAGLVDTRVGARGGAFLKVPTGTKIGQGIADMVTMAALDAQEVTEARLVVELGVVELVCQRADKQDLEDLEQICEGAEKALREGNYDVQHSADFHLRFVKAAHNRALDLLVASFGGSLRSSLQTAKLAAPSMGQRGAKEHRALVNAVGAGDVAAAQEIMEAHLGRTAQRLRTKPE